MIYIDVYLPAVSQTIEVRANEGRTIGALKEELCLLARKLLREEEKIIPGFELYDDARKELLPDDRTLFECGISSGSRLMFF